jgi:hypothetical protein
MNLIAKAIKEKMDKFDYTKMKIFHAKINIINMFKCS